MGLVPGTLPVIAHAIQANYVAPILLLLMLILLGAIVGRLIAKRLGQPEVLGELLAGVAIGTLASFFYGTEMLMLRHGGEVSRIITTNLFQGVSMEQAARLVLSHEAFAAYGGRLVELLLTERGILFGIALIAIDVFSQLGMILLLFMVGLEFRIEELLETGATSMLVAIIGVILPFILGFYSTMLIMPGLSSHVYIFVGATFCATSIGITARVFKDLRKLKMAEAKVVMSAAVIDDILGLIVLAVVTGIIVTGSVRFSNVLWITVKSVLFLVITVLVGGRLVKPAPRMCAVLGRTNVKILYPFLILMFLSWLCEAVGLAMIVGAFTAGLIIKDEHFLAEECREFSEETVATIFTPLEAVFAPVFFVFMGLQVDVTAFTDVHIAGMAAILTMTAILGKLAAGLPLRKGSSRLIVGIGLIPRGEVGLIFASLGKSLGVLSATLFSVIVAVIILTTFTAPPALKWAIERRRRKPVNPPAEGPPPS